MNQHKESITQYCERDMKKYKGTVSYADMQHFLSSRGTHGEGLRMMLEGARIYCEAYAKEQEGKIGDDGYMGKYTECILRNIHYLLSGLGRFDGGTLSGFICDLAKKHNLDIE